MIRYILKRVVAALITIWFIMTLTFVLMYAIPGSPIRKSCTAWKKLPTIAHSPRVPAT